MAMTAADYASMEQAAAVNESDRLAENARKATNGDVAVFLMLDALRHEIRASRIGIERSLDDIADGIAGIRDGR